MAREMFSEFPGLNPYFNVLVTAMNNFIYRCMLAITNGLLKNRKLCLIFFYLIICIKYCLIFYTNQIFFCLCLFQESMSW